MGILVFGNNLFNLMNNKIRNTRYRKLRLRTAAYSCHEHARKKINSSIRDTILKNSNLHYNAYFCDIPSIRLITNGSDIPNLIVPFIDREITKKTLSLFIEKNITKKSLEKFLSLVKINPGDNISKSTFHIPMAYTDKLKIFNLWDKFSDLGPITVGTIANELFENWRHDSDLGKGKILPTPFYAIDCIMDISKKLSEPSLDVFQKLTYLNIFALQYGDLMKSDNQKDCLFFLGVPICTKITFYGLLIATIETPNGKSLFENEKDKINKALGNLCNVLEEEAQKTYLHTLILTQNSWEESEFYDFLNKENGKENFSFENFIKKEKLVYSRIAYSSLKKHDSILFDLLEEKIINIWKLRKNTFKEKDADLKESLVFRKMMVASPGLISSINSAASLSLSEPKEAPLPCVLVIAPPGSGKEMMSRIIPLFSDFFWNKPVITLNMGSILTELHKFEGLKKIFQKLSDSTLIKNGATLVLDELNSLDIKAQPTLLRLLEQGEIEELSNLKTQRKNSEDKNKTPKWLIIGLMNEEPARLTLETLRDKFTNEKLFGELLGVFLYEFFKDKSRLRDDIYYRIRRSGEIKIDGLNERRPDIPIIFYFMIRKFLKNENDNTEVFLTCEAMDLLIDKTIDWKGNIRKLENLVRQVKAKIERNHIEKSLFIIDNYHIENALIDIAIESI